MTATYAFRDGEVAARRLALVADVFEPPSRAFLAAAGRRGVGLALDLGCGPGHTTRLLADVLAPRRTMGLDSSTRFVEQARLGGGEFELVDVTREPLPAADLAYCRFLLSHIADPVATVAAWASALRPGGQLLLDEVEWIATDDPVFRRYLDTVRALLSGRGHRLEVGPELGAAYGGSVATLAVEPDAATRMFTANLRAWSDKAPRGLAAELARGERGPIVWGLRQIALDKEDL